MTNWICLECDKIFNADSSESFSSEDVECPRCGAGWEDVREIVCDPDDYDHDYTILW